MSVKLVHRSSVSGKIRGSALLSAAISSCLAMAAHAQQAPQATPAKDASLEEVVVTGFRASLVDALTKKRESTQIIESITAEDIGKFPDQNVTESLQRLPGVQIDRSGGQGTAVLIDGLRQNLITLNGESFLTGKEFYVSGEAANGGAGSNAQLSSLEGIPSEQVGGIDIIKSPNASNTEGGLGGIIDLKTRSPLAQSMGFNLGGSVRGTKAQSADGSVTPIIALIGGFKFSDDFGITAGFSYDDEKTHTKEFQDQNRSSWLFTNFAQDGTYQNGTSSGASLANTISTIGQHYYIPQLAYFSDILDTRKTTGATLGAEWRWSSGIKSTFNWFYSREADESITYSNKAWFNGQGAAAINSNTHLPDPVTGIDKSQPYSIDGNGVVQSASFMANGAETATLYQNTVSQANNFQFLTTFDNGGPLRGDVNASYSKATSDLQADQADIEHGAYTAFGSPAFIMPNAPGCNNGATSCGVALGDPADPTNPGNHGYVFNYTNGGNSGLPTISYPNKYGVTNVLSNPDYTLFKSNWAWANLTDQKQFSLKGDIKYDPANTKDMTLSAGLRYAGRDVDQTFGRYLINGATLGLNGKPAGQDAGNCCTTNSDGSHNAAVGTWLYYSDPGYASIPYSTAATNPGLVKYYNNFASGTIAVKDPSAGGMTNPSTYLNSVWAQAGLPNNTETFFKDTLSSFQVKERSTTVYLMASAGSREDHYHVDGGVRVVNTNLTIDNGQQAPSPTYYGTASWNGVNSNNLAVEHSRNYVDVLPSFNISLDLTDTQKIRVGAARVVSPQNLFQLGVGNSYNFSRGTGADSAKFKFVGGSSGNPDLDPYRASQFNVSYENYFTEGALVTAGIFYKSVDNFVETQNITTVVNDDFGGTPADVSQPVNAGNGKIYGLELGGQYAWSSGFGVTANYTHSNSTSDQHTAFANALAIPGVSKNAFNATGYYEHAGFSARLAYSWRSEAVNDSLVGATFAFADQNGNQKVYGVFSAPYGQLDAQVSYDFNEHIGILASANNLTDEKQHTYLQFSNLPFTYDDSGTRFFIGVKGKL